MVTMNIRTRLAELSLRLRWAVAPARRKLRLFWYRADWEGMAFGLFAGTMVMGFAFGVHATLAYQDQMRDQALQSRKSDPNLCKITDITE